MDAFLIGMARRYDIKGKTYFNYPNKYYYTDNGLRNARLNYRQYDPGHMMENIIYNVLVLRAYSVDVGMVLERKKKEKIQREIKVAESVLDVLTPTTGALVHNAGSCFVVLIAALLYDGKYKENF